MKKKMILAIATKETTDDLGILTLPDYRLVGWIKNYEEYTSNTGEGMVEFDVVFIILQVWDDGPVLIFDRHLDGIPKEDVHLLLFNNHFIKAGNC
jgi:hypothetical protein